MEKFGIFELLDALSQITAGTDGQNPPSAPRLHIRRTKTRPTHLNNKRRTPIRYRARTIPPRRLKSFFPATTAFRKRSTKNKTECENLSALLR